MKQTVSDPEFTPQEIQLRQRRCQQPALFPRLHNLLVRADATAGSLATADAVEGLLLQELRALGRTAMQEWARPAAARVNAELRAAAATVRSRKKKTLTWWGVFGQVRVPDHGWRSASQNYIRPLPARLGVTPRGRSQPLARVLTDFGSEPSFAQAADRVREHYGFTSNVSAVRHTTLEHAQRARRQLEAQYAQSFRELPAVGAAQVIAEADGTMICTVQPGPRKGQRPRQWRAMRLVAAQAKDTATTGYGATVGGVAATGQRWGHVTRAAGWGWNSRLHAVGDGAGWIPWQGREVFGPQGHFLCDCFHVSEYLGAAAPSCRPAQPATWRRTQQRRLKRGAGPQVLAALATRLEAETLADEEAPGRSAQRYLSNRRTGLDYPGALALGLPIGSGMIESGHRHVLQARLNKAGTAWLPEPADQLAH